MLVTLSIVENVDLRPLASLVLFDMNTYNDGIIDYLTDRSTCRPCPCLVGYVLILGRGMNGVLARRPPCWFRALVGSRHLFFVQFEQSSRSVQSSI